MREPVLVKCERCRVGIKRSELVTPVLKMTYATNGVGRAADHQKFAHLACPSTDKKED